MDIFWRLILAHLLADFTFQTDFIARWKRKNLFGGIAHSFVFFICASALCYGRLAQSWNVFGRHFPVNGWVALAILTLLHFLEDDWRVRAVKRSSSADTFIFFLIDQFVHVALIFIFFPFQYPGYNEKWVFLAILFILATHFSSIFVYFAEKGATGTSRLDSSERYYSMGERLFIGLALLLPGLWACSFAAAWLVRIVFKRGKNPDVTFLNTIVSNALAIVIGIAARLVLYAC